MRDQMRGVTVAKDAVRRGVKTRIVLVPTHAFTGFERLGNLRFVGKERLAHAEESAHIDLALVVGQERNVLGRERKALRCGIVGNIAGSGLICQPFPDVALVRPGLLGDLLRGLRSARCKRFVQPELIADQHRCCSYHGAYVAQKAPDGGFELRGIVRECRCGQGVVLQNRKGFLPP